MSTWLSVAHVDELFVIRAKDPQHRPFIHNTTGGTPQRVPFMNTLCTPPRLSQDIIQDPRHQSSVHPTLAMYLEPIASSLHPI